MCASSTGASGIFVHVACRTDNHQQGVSIHRKSARQAQRFRGALRLVARVAQVIGLLSVHQQRPRRHPHLRAGVMLGVHGEDARRADDHVIDVAPPHAYRNRVQYRPLGAEPIEPFAHMDFAQRAREPGAGIRMQWPESEDALQSRARDSLLLQDRAFENDRVAGGAGSQVRHGFPLSSTGLRQSFEHSEQGSTLEAPFRGAGFRRHPSNPTSHASLTIGMP